MSLDLPGPPRPTPGPQNLCKRHVSAGVRRLPSAGAARQGWKGGSVSADLAQKDAGPPSLTSVWLESQNQSQDAVRCAAHGDSDAGTAGDHQLWAPSRSGQPTCSLKLQGPPDDRSGREGPVPRAGSSGPRHVS